MAHFRLVGCCDWRCSAVFIAFTQTRRDVSS